MRSLVSRRSFLWAGCAVLVATSFSLTFAPGSRAADVPGPESFKGQAAPDFTLKTVTGESATLSAQKGKVVLVDFWATWCGPCVQSLPHIESLAKNKEMADKGLVVYAVNLREDGERIKAFLASKNLSLTVPMDAEGSTAEKYKIVGIPTTLVIGRDGKVAEVFVGAGGDTAERLDKAVEAALAQKAGA